ncbi:MAG: hypothetical protein MI864_15215, partial [Pseudomonadales bacterium]|nr:hypothetical protein [Pseudomonadales bacterium]
MAKLILGNNDIGKTFTISSPDPGTVWEVLGTNSEDKIQINAGANAKVNLLGGNDKISCSGNAADYKVKANGSTVTLTHSDNSKITIAASTIANTISFNDGVSLDLEIDTTLGAVVLGSQTLTATEADIADTGDSDDDNSPDPVITYPTIDYLPDLTEDEMANATLAILTPYTPTYDSITWDYSYYYGESGDYALLRDTFTFLG